MKHEINTREIVHKSNREFFFFIHGNMEISEFEFHFLNG